MKTKKKIRAAALLCYYCERDFTIDRYKTVDHVFPISKGGTDHAGNLVPACSQCNSVKSCFDIHEFKYVLSCNIKSKKDYGGISVDVLKVIYKNVVTLSKQEIAPNLERVVIPSFNVHTEYFAIQQNTVTVQKLDVITLQLYHKRLARERQAILNEQTLNNIEGYIPDGSKYVCFHI